MVSFHPILDALKINDSAQSVFAFLAIWRSNFGPFKIKDIVRNSFAFLNMSDRRARGRGSDLHTEIP